MVHQLKLAYVVLSCLVLGACGSGGGGSNNNNLPPRFAATSSQSVDAGDALTFTVTATDPDGPAPLRMSIQSSSPALPTGFTFNDNGNGVGTFNWSPVLADVGTYVVTFAATESGGTGKSSTRLVNITVSDPSAGNEPPTVTATGNKAVDEGELLSFMVNATDPDGPAPLTMTLSNSMPTLPAGATYNDNGSGVGVFNWTPAPGDAGDYEVTFTATDGAGLESSQTIIISVAVANEAPELAPIGNRNATVGQLLSFDVSAQDPDGPLPLAMTITGSVPALPAGATYVDNGGGMATFSWTPAPGESGTYSVTFSATDGDGLADSETISISVNEAPTLGAIVDQNVTIGSLLQFTVTATDPDGPAPLLMTLETSVPALPAAATYTDNGDGTGSFSWQTTVADAGTYDVTFRASESGGSPLFDEQTTTISVIDPNAGNDAPVLAPIGNRSATVGQPLTFDVSAQDPDGPLPLAMTITDSVPPLPAGATYVDNGSGMATFSWTPVSGESGTYSVTFSATDGGGLADSETISISVNEAPTLDAIVDQNVTIGGLLEFTVTATDPDGPAPLLMTLETSVPALPAAAIYTDNGDGTGSFSWQTMPADAGTYDVTFRASESGGSPLFDEQTITITVNQPPTLNPVADQSVLVGDALAFAVTAMDPDGPAPLLMTLETSVPALPAAATFTDNGDGSADFDWTPVSADNGSYLVTFSATENGGTGASTEQTMTIWVRANDTFSDDFEDGNANGWTVVNDTNAFSNWTVTGSAGRQQFRQLVTQGTTESSGGLDSIYHLGSYAYRPDVTLTDFHLLAEVQLRSEFGEECGLMWRYQDGDNYYRVSFNLRNSFSLLERKVGGVWTTLARNSRGLVKDQEYVVAITTQGPVLHVAVDGELLFAAHDNSLDTGSIGVYARADCGFDFVDVTPVNANATVAIAQPTDFSVDAGTDITVAATVLNRPTQVGVDFELNSVSCDPVTESAPGLFESTCSAPMSGVYVLDADLTDNLALIDSDSHGTVGAGGDHYAALGDSISDGSPFDNYSTDGTTTPGWVVSSQGYNANLTDALNAGDPTRPHIVADFAVPSDRSANTVARLPGILEQSPDSNQILLLIGTNDARDNVVLNTYRQNVQAIIDAATNVGKVVWVSRVLPVMGPDVGPPFVDPAICDGNFPCQNGFVRAYNLGIETQLTGHNIGPDLYGYFLGDGENRVTLFRDNLHPNGLGTAVLGALWNNALTGETDLPFVLEDIEVRLSQGGAPASPILYKQNLLEVGDEFFIDDPAVLTASIPAALQDGVWIMTADADVNQNNTDYLSFDAGASPVDVYLAYDAGVALPAGLAANFVDIGLDITTDHPNAPTMDVYVWANQSGTVVLDGADGGSTGADVNYAVIVVKQ